MKWLVIVAVALVLLVLIPLVIGALLPVGHTASRALVLRAPPEAVWTVVADAAGAPAWRKELAGVELLPPEGGLERYRESSRFGVLTFEVLESQPPRRRVTRIVGAEREGFGGRWTYELTPEGSGTRVTVTEDGEVYSPLFRFLSRFVFGYTRTLDDYLAALAQRLGESARPGPAHASAR